MSEKKIIKVALKATPLFQLCDDDLIDKFATLAQLKVLEKGQVVFLQQEPAKFFYAIRTGRIKLFRETAEGDQTIIDILPKNEVFGETAFFEGEHYPYGAEATENSEVFVLPLSELRNSVKNNPEFAMSMLNTMARHRKHQDMELEHRTIQTAPQRIGCFLLKLAYQKHLGTDSIEVQLPYDKTLIASRLGIKPETFSRALSKLKQETGVKVKGANIKVDSLDKLAQFSCVACSYESPCKNTR